MCKTTLMMGEGGGARTLVGINEETERSFAYLVHRHAGAVRKTSRLDGITGVLG